MLHPQIDKLISNQLTDSNEKNVMIARRKFNFSRRNFRKIPVNIGSVEDQMIVCDNLQIPIRIYTPKGDGPFPILVYYHGGGFVLGDLETMDNLCQCITYYANQIVVSVDYRLAPEHPYPAAIDDAWASLQWVYHNASQINGLNKIISVAGDSAGGNLAAQMAILARDLGDFKIASQWLFYPWLDFSLSSHSHNLYGKGYNLTTEELKWFTSAYLPDQSIRYLPDASPLYHEDLSSLPNAFIFTAQYDPLQDDGMKYTQALRKAGNFVDYTCYKGFVHSFLNMAGEVEEIEKVMNQMINRIKQQTKEEMKSVYSKDIRNE